MKTRINLLIIIFSIMLSLFCNAEDYTWTGAVSTDWGNPANWDPVGLPTSVDDVSIESNVPNNCEIPNGNNY
ncbi:MAG: hypothetical protein B6D61_07140, partial [Bacteroidetes bacterium 4484_249]